MRIIQTTLLFLVSCLSFPIMANAAGEAAFEAIEPFNSIKASGDIDVRIVSAAQGYGVRIDGEGKVEIKVINNTLYVSRKSSKARKFRSKKQQQTESRPQVSIQVTGLHELSYNGPADVSAENLKSALLDVNVNTPGKVVLNGQIGLRDLQVRGSGEVNIDGINSRDLAVTMAGDPTVVLRGSADLKTLDYSGSGQLNFSTIDSAELTVKGSGTAVVQLTGKVQNLKVELTNKAHFNGISLHAQQAYVETYQQSLAEISVVNKQDTLASDESNIYYYQDPEFKADFMAQDGTVLNMVNMPAQTA